MNPAAELQILRAPAVAAALNLSVSTLAKMRMSGDGPPFVKLGSRAVGYRSIDVQKWLEEQQRQRTRT